MNDDRPEDVGRFLELIWLRGEVRELRVPRHNRYGQTASGYFSDPTGAAAAAAGFDGRANIYVTINPVDPAILARAAERIELRATQTTADSDIVARRWLLIDIDPVRPGGISSTDAELAAARSVTEAVTSFLEAENWPEPVIAMSGNGYHALYRIDLPNDAGATALVTSALRALAARHDTPGAHVDLTVANAARISALVGTIKMKGDPLLARPHRRSSLERIPTQLVVVTKERLAAVAALGTSSGPGGATRRAAGGPARLAAMLADAGIASRVQPPDAAGIVWHHVEHCPFHDDGRPFECGVGEARDGHFAGKCFHPEGADQGWRGWKAALGLGRTDPDRWSPRMPALATASSVAPAAAGGFARTDAGNGEYFARLHGNRLRYDHRRGRWLVWADHWWRDDDTRQVRRLAKEAARERYGQATAIGDLRERADEARFAIGSENRARLDAMLLAAQSEPPIADGGAHWDADPWLLGVSNGVVDLRTGTLRAGSPDDRITLHTEVAFEPGARCPRWERFLDEVFAGDEDLIGYIARAMGYSLTGDTTEQCLFTCYGRGANGKSVFLTIARAMAGLYAANTPFSTFELRTHNSIPNDLAALAGRRMVTASETAEGTRLNESRLKALTGSDPITARFLHGEFFTYRPVAKFWLAVNHTPRVSDDSYGFWRRVRLIPFTRQFTMDADRTLAEVLLGELPGILAWAVRGALAWQDRGLLPPDAVSAATEDYRTESDPLVEFVDGKCVVGEDVVVGATAAYRAYRAWALEAGLAERETLTATNFGGRMKSRFSGAHRKKGNVYIGVGLLSDRWEGSSIEPVKGWVKGSEHASGEPEVFPSSPAPTGGKPENAFTTLHPSSPRPVPVEVDYRGSASDSTEPVAQAGPSR
jgi:putative DNA primase/helicase